MTELVVRRPDFGIDESVPFQWQPANPGFGLFGNTFTFLAIAFERYIVAATRRAMPLLSEGVAEEADLFIRQEAQHARAHRAHAKALIAQYPALEGTLSAAGAAYDEMLAREDFEFHLAYIADLEATFTPLFKMVFDHRQGLFEGGDERVGTLLLWHFAEEIEHRSSALIIHHDVTSDPWYRIRHAPRVFRHVSNVYRMVLDGFEKHVPLADRAVPTATISPHGLYLSEISDRTRQARRRSSGRSMLSCVPARDLMTMLWRETRAQTPRHDPAEEPTPAWAENWHSAWRAGADVTTYTGVGLAAPPDAVASSA